MGVVVRSQLTDVLRISAFELYFAPPAAVMAPNTVIPGVMSKVPGFATHPYTPTWPADGTRTISPGRAGISRHPTVLGLVRSMTIGSLPAPSGFCCRDPASQRPSLEVVGE